ncbi:MAG: hypothetical protein IH865_05280 [Chloroflexi bacterium]|nr:hypothetical protein [Chloroflexota bacterium]
MTKTKLPPALELLGRFDVIATPESAGEVLTNLARLVTDSLGEDAEHRRHIAATIDLLPNSIRIAEVATLDAFQQAMETKVQEHPEEAPSLLGCQLRLAPRLSAERVQAISAMLQSFLQNGAPDVVRKFISVEAKQARDLINPGAWYGPLNTRLSQVTDEDSAYQLIAASLEAGRILGDREGAVSDLASALRNSTQPGWKAVLRATQRALQTRTHLTRPISDVPLVEALIKAVLDGAGTNPAAASPEAIDLTFEAMKSWNTAHDAVLEAMGSLVSGNKEVGARLLKELLLEGINRKILSDTERRTTFELIVNHLNHVTPSSPGQVAELYECLMLLTKERTSQKEDVYRVIRDYSRPDATRPNHIPEEFRKIGYLKIAELEYLPRSRPAEELSLLFQEAKAAAEPLRMEIVKAIVALRKAGLEQDSEVWQEIKEFFDSAGGDYSRMAAGM